MLEQFSTVAHTYWTHFLYLLPRLAIGLVILLVTWGIASRARTYLSAQLGRRSTDPLLSNFLTEVGRWLLVFGGVMLALQIIGFSGVVSGLVGGLGLSAFLVGFAFKDIAENFLAGVILAFNRPFHINDSIQINDMLGRVVELSLRTTRMKTYDGKDIYIPNSLVLKEPVTNLTRDGQIRQDFLLILDPKADVPTLTEKVLTQIRQQTNVLTDDLHHPYAVTEDLTPTAVNVRFYFWADSDDYRRNVKELRGRLIEAARVALQAAATPPAS